ncbi:helix-turn-helix domain-containing protein [Amycolatopsis nigrescens]|uniref:helix-turn-helix domain-containing protein n=1 Tax=Amycolatopsis nigrescens TaxID=381445 RepID=UPI0012F76F01|nr:XRE family transcriptional regulator [Amycolatopsis nigrescens]
MAIVQHWTGRDAKLLRAALRLSVRDFSATLGVGARTVSKWEARGEDISPTPDMQAILDTALARASDEVRHRFSLSRHNENSAEPAIASAVPLTPSAVDLHSFGNVLIEEGVPFQLSATRVAEGIEEFTASDMATRRAFLLGLSLLSGAPLVRQIRQWAAQLPVVPVRAGEVGQHELAELEQAVTFFRRWDASGKGGLHRKAVIGQLNAVAEILREQSDANTDRRLFQVVAELAQLAGWMTYDAGAFGLSQRYYLSALHACQHAGATDLGAKVIGDMTQLSTALGNYDDSLTLTRTALAAMPRDGNPLVRSELLGLEARAHAQLGPSEAGSARRAVEACIEVFDEATPDQHVDWIHYMNQAEVECLAANTYTELALHEPEPKRALVHANRAEAHTLGAIDSRGGAYARSRIIDEIRLGKVRLAQQEPAEAANIGLRALEQADTMRSSVVVKWLNGLATPLADRYGDVRAVSELKTAVAAYHGAADGRQVDAPGT